MRVSEIMTPAVRVVPPNLDAEAAWRKMRAAKIHHFVVMDEAHVVGVVSAHDLGGTRAAATRKGRTVGDMMTADPVVAAPTTTVREAANVLRGRVIGCLPVVEGTRLVGIVTTTDLLELIGRGIERPIAASTRWVLRARGSRQRAQVRARAAADRSSAHAVRARR